MLCCHSPTRRGRLPELETEESIFLSRLGIKNGFFAALRVTALRGLRQGRK